MQRRRVLAACGAALAGATAGCSSSLLGGSNDGSGSDAGPVPTTVPGSVGGRYTGFQGGPTHRGVADGSIGGSLATVWRHGAASEPTGNELGTPAVADGVVYAPEGTIDGETAVTYLSALDLRTGAVDWQYEFPETNAADDAVYADGTVFQRISGVLVAVDAASGEERWRLSADLDAVPAVADGRVFVTGTNLDGATLYALDAATGDELWTRSFTPAVRGDVVTPAVADGVVYHVEKQVVALDAASGDELWTGRTDEPPATAPTVADDTLYVGTARNGIAALTRDGGDQRWWSQVMAAGTAGNRGPPASPAVAGGTVYTTSSWAGTALDAASGEEVWARELDVDGPPVVAGETLFVAGLDRLAGFATADGSLVDEVPTDNESGQPVSPAVVDGGLVYPGDEFYAVVGV